MARCLFCAIVTGENPAPVVFEDEVSIAFLDHRPIFPGHSLLIPRDHYETLPDLPQQLLAPLFHNAQKLARAVVEGLGAEGSFVAINNRISQSVPHLHIHVVPRRAKDGLRGFFWPRQHYAGDEQMIEVRDKLREAMRGMR